MSWRGKSEHIIPIADMPRFDESAPALEVFKSLARSGRGGFILEEGGKQRFVKAAELARETLIGAPRARMLGVGEKSTIGSLCDAPRARDAVLAIEADPVTIDSPLVDLQQIPEDKVFTFVDGNEVQGYFLNHETLLDPATKRLVFICANGHRNADPDHGSCYSCPAEIVEVLEE